MSAPNSPIHTFGLSYGGSPQVDTPEELEVRWRRVNNLKGIQKINRAIAKRELQRRMVRGLLDQQATAELIDRLVRITHEIRNLKLQLTVLRNGGF